MMNVQVEWFGRTLTVPAQLSRNGFTVNEGEPEATLIVGRGEDMYALTAPFYKDKIVAVVTESDLRIARSRPMQNDLPPSSLTDWATR